MHKIVFSMRSSLCWPRLWQRHQWRLLNSNFGFCSPSRQIFRQIRSVTNQEHEGGFDNLDSTHYLYPQIRGGELDPQFLADTIRQWLSCSTDQALEVLKESPNLKRSHLDSVKDCINYLKENGIVSDVIVENPWLLNYTLSTIRQRIDSLAPVRVTAAVIPLLKLPPKQLSKIAKQWTSDVQNGNCGNFESRLEFLAHHLDCRVKDVSIQMDRHSYVLTSNFNKLSRTLLLLLQYGIKPIEILNNLSLFQHRDNQIESRLKDANEANIVKVKVWMLQCPKTVFLRNIGRLQDMKDGLENKDVVMYLAERLECNQEYVLCLAKRYPPLLAVRLTKLKAVLDFLFANGFTPNQVCLAPHVFRNSVFTLKNRLEDFRKHGYQPVHLHSLCASTKEHRRFLEQLQEKKTSHGS